MGHASTGRLLQGSLACLVELHEARCKLVLLLWGQELFDKHLACVGKLGHAIGALSLQLVRQKGDRLMVHRIPVHITVGHGRQGVHRACCQHTKKVQSG